MDADGALPLRMWLSCSARTSNVLMEDLSSGIMCRLFQAPHAYWKKSWQGDAVRSMAESRDAAAAKAMDGLQGVER